MWSATHYTGISCRSRCTETNAWGPACDAIRNRRKATSIQKNVQDLDPFRQVKSMALSNR